MIRRIGFVLSLVAGLLLCLYVSPTPTANAHKYRKAIKTKRGCNLRIAKRPKRKRCKACVKSGRHFHKFGRGGFGKCHR